MKFFISCAHGEAEDERLRTRLAEALAAAGHGVVMDSHGELSALPSEAAKVDELLARFYERRALREESLEDRDNAILWRIRAQAAARTEERDRRLGELAGQDYKNLVATMHTGESRLGIDLKSLLTGFVAFSPDGSASAPMLHGSLGRRRARGPRPPDTGRRNGLGAGVR